MMRNFKRPMSLLFVLVIAASCASQNIDSFSINKSELLGLMESTSSQQQFINTWNLRTCYEDDFSHRFCYGDSLITFETLKSEGFILSTSTVKFEGWNTLKDDLARDFRSVPLSSLDGYDTHLGKFNLKEVIYYFNEEYDVVLGEVDTGNGQKVYVITVNKR